MLCNRIGIIGFGIIGKAQHIIINKIVSADVELFTPIDKDDDEPNEDLNMILDYITVNFFSKNNKLLSINK
jgi:hypothetical protein|tara:strand:+ start:178 stop:390 length:213 start_codon:yes stop_codon:yes gene_type:complete